MKVFISPAKRMRTDSDSFHAQSMPFFIDQTRRICREIQSLSYDEAKRIWKCNDKIAGENFERFAEMDLERNLTPAVFSYDGLLYRSMAPGVFSDSELEYIGSNLYILSAFYGALRAFDGVVPYRLEMAASLPIDDSQNLYQFWEDKLYKFITADDNLIVNLASKEYSKTITKYLSSDVKMITCNFGYLENGRIKQKATLAKMSRGEMVRYMAENNVTDPEQLKSYSRLGFSYNEELSDENNFNFIFG